jgi:hypothetical protein
MIPMLLVVPIEVLVPEHSYFMIRWFFELYSPVMDNSQLADVLIERLNHLISDLDVRKDISTLIETRVACSAATLDHPTIQASSPARAADGATGAPSVGVLGLLNGLVGVIPDGPKKGWGFITAELDDDGILTGFQRTK